MKYNEIDLLNAPASMPATPVSMIHYIYHSIELLVADAHSHIEELVFGTIQIMIQSNVFPSNRSSKL